MSRSDGSTANPGRNVTNEPDVVSTISTFLQNRGRGEQLAHWSDIRPRFEGNLDGLVQYMWRNVSAIVGPHGGALMNHRFTGPETLLLEFLPTSRLSYLNFEETSILNQTYAAVVVEPVEGTPDDLVIDPADVVGLLETYLGKPREEKMVLGYQWDRE